MRFMNRTPLPDLTDAQRRVWRKVCTGVAAGCVIYLGSVVWIMVAEFRYETWTPPRSLFMLSFVIMTVLSAGVLSEGRARPERLKAGHGWMAVGASLLWLGFCLFLYVAFGARG